MSPLVRRGGGVITPSWNWIENHHRLDVNRYFCWASVNVEKYRLVSTSKLEATRLQQTTKAALEWTAGSRPEARFGPSLWSSVPSASRVALLQETTQLASTADDGCHRNTREHSIVLSSCTSHPVAPGEGGVVIAMVQRALWVAAWATWRPLAFAP